MFAQRPQFRLYIDESGDVGYGRLNEPPWRYLCLLGVWFQRPDDYLEFATALDDLKKEVFGDKWAEVILHRDDIINKRAHFGILCDPAKERLFNDLLCSLIEHSKYRVIAVVLDKKWHSEQYVHPNHPYHYCVEAMLDRYCGWLRYKRAIGDVTAEARGKVEDRALNAAYSGVLTNGSMFWPAPHHRAVLTSKKIKFKLKSDNIHGHQLADVLAHPVRQMIIREIDASEKPLAPFAQRLSGCIDTKFNRRAGDGEIWGYGKVLLPRKKKAPF